MYIKYWKYSDETWQKFWKKNWLLLNDELILKTFLFLWIFISHIRGARSRGTRPCHHCTAVTVPPRTASGSYCPNPISHTQSTTRPAKLDGACTCSEYFPSARDYPGRNTLCECSLITERCYVFDVWPRTMRTTFLHSDENYVVVTVTFSNNVILPTEIRSDRYRNLRYNIPGRRQWKNTWRSCPQSKRRRGWRVMTYHVLLNTTNRVT